MMNHDVEHIEAELKTFTARNFERPSACRNGEQIRFYARELCLKIEEYKTRFNYVPGWAYGLLAQYNAKQNDITYPEYKTNYH
ncbi:MAG: hypothetical protein WAZ98_13630 [Cyclobacteriaceae bacterium]